MSGRTTQTTPAGAPARPRRLLWSGAVALVAAVAVALPVTAALTRPAPPAGWPSSWADDAAAALVTPLEASGDYTSLTDEAEFWSDLAAASPRVSYTQIGQSVRGRRIDLIGIGADSPPVPGESSGALLVTALVHGDERIGREVVMTLARDLALTAAPEAVRYLEAHPVFLVPTVNPDKFEEWGYHNANDVNLNRDLAQITQPESRAVMATITAVRPQLTVDLHEAGDAEEDVMVEAASLPAVDEELADLGQRLLRDVRGRLSAQRVSNALWPFPVTDGVTIQDAAALSHSLNLLVETDYVHRGIADRHRFQLGAVQAAMEFHAAHTSEVAAAVAGSRERARAEARAGAPYVFRDGERIDPAPTAYRLTEEQFDRVAPVLDAMGIVAEADGDGWRVDRDQDAALLIPTVLDEHSPDRTVVAQPLFHG